MFQDYYTSLPEFSNDKSKVALIGTIAQGLSYLGAPFSAALTKRFHKYQRQQLWVAWPICILGLLIGSFATSIAGLIATQGVMYGIGFVLLTYPIISMIDEWWIARKGMAFGLISAASGGTGAVMPFVLEAMLHKYGYKVTLRASAIAMTILTGPLLPALKGRLPPAERSAMARTNRSFLRNPLFWIYCLSTLIQGFGFFFPSLYLPSYATDIGLEPRYGALLLAIMAVAQVLGQFAFGYMSDKKISVSTLAAACSLVATITALALWGTAKSIGLLLVFSTMYGFFAYGFGSMRIAMGKAVSSDPSAAVATYATLVFVQGIGNVLAAPVSSLLLSPSVRLGEYGASRYKDLVVFTGSCMFASALIIALWHSVGFFWTRAR